MLKIDNITSKDRPIIIWEGDCKNIYASNGYRVVVNVNGVLIVEEKVSYDAMNNPIWTSAEHEEQVKVISQVIIECLNKLGGKF